MVAAAAGYNGFMRTRWVLWMAVMLGVGVGVGEAARLLVTPGRAVFSAGPAGRAVVLQAEAATRVEATVGERKRVFVTDKDGVWELSSVGATRWDEKSWEAGALWLAALLRGIDPKAGGVRAANGVLAGMDEKKVGQATLPRLETQRDGKGVTALRGRAE